MSFEGDGIFGRTVRVLSPSSYIGQRGWKDNPREFNRLGISGCAGATSLLRVSSGSASGNAEIRACV